MTFDEVFPHLVEGRTIYRQSQNFDYHRSGLYEWRIEKLCKDGTIINNDISFDVEDLFAKDWEVKIGV